MNAGGAVTGPACVIEGRTELIAELQAEFAAMYREHQAGMVAMLRQRVPRHEAEDLAQDVFVAVLKRDGCNPTLGPRHAYLRGIAHNKAVDWHRRQATKETRDRFAAAQRASSVNIDDTVCATADAARVRAALMSLNENRRRPILLAFYGGLSHSEVAIALATPLGTVKTRIREGLLQLRAQLSPVLD